jgi:bifunctional NMN adenylyltransferase/nudix hydrolase
MHKVEQKYDVGVIVARFQVPELHSVHTDLINYVIGRHSKVIIFIGLTASSVFSKKNPLDFQSREQMIREKYPDNIIISHITDNKSDTLWSKILDSKISELVGPAQTVVLYGGRDSFIPHYDGRFHTIELEGISDSITGTKIREECKVACIPDTNFRKGVIWSKYNEYPRVIPVVDVAVMKDDCLILGVKNQDLGKLCFIGGFADINSSSYEHDAKRETMEELKVEAGNFVFIGSRNVNDWRYTPDTGCVMRTAFFACEYMYGPISASDDLDDFRIIKIADLTEDMFTPYHAILFNVFMEWYNKRNN